RTARVGHHDVEERPLLGTVTGHTNSKHSFSFDNLQRGKPGGGIMPPRLRMNPFSPSLFTRFIILSMSACCLISLLTSCTCTPEPLAMRFLREAWMMSGLRRSLGVME